MKISYLWLAALTPLVAIGSGCDQFASKEAVLDAAAKLVVEKYENASCEEVAAMQSPSDEGSQAEMQKKAIALLQKNPELREEFINRVAGPIANRMFECDLIP